MTTAPRLFVLLSLVACGGESGPSGDAGGGGTTVIAMEKAGPSGDGQTALIGATLPQPLRIRVTQDALPLAGRVVLFTPGTGAGSVDPTADTTDLDGIASTVWTLGTASGIRSVTVTSLEVTGSPLFFQATALPGSAAALVSFSGSGQAQLPGVRFPLPLIARVTDAFNNPIAGVTVQWAVASGPGAIVSAAAVTLADGRAQSFVDAGDSVGALAVRATSTAVASDTAHFQLQVVAEVTTISVSSNLFSPQHLTAPAGVAVRWRWTSGEHNVAPLDGPASFPSSPLQGVGSIHGPFVFTIPGVYNYQCAVHDGMVGSITIEPASPTGIGEL